MVNGVRIGSRAVYYAVMDRLKTGDTVEVDLRGKPAVQVTVSGYSQPRVRLLSL